MVVGTTGLAAGPVVVGDDIHDAEKQQGAAHLASSRAKTPAAAFFARWFVWVPVQVLVMLRQHDCCLWSPWLTSLGRNLEPRRWSQTMRAVLVGWPFVVVAGGRPQEQRSSVPELEPAAYIVAKQHRGHTTSATTKMCGAGGGPRS